MLYSSGIFAGTFSTLFVFQFHAFTSFIFTVTELMIIETTVFLFILFVNYAGFSITFYVLETPIICHDDLNFPRTSSNREPGVNHDFFVPELFHENGMLFTQNTSMNGTVIEDMYSGVSPLTSTLYSTLLRLLNLKGPDDVFFRDANNPQTFAMMFYVLAALMWPLMLLNMLIALYNDRMQVINQHRQVIAAVQNLNITLLLHQTYYAPLSNIRHWMTRRNKVHSFST